VFTCARYVQVYSRMSTCTRSINRHLCQNECPLKNPFQPIDNTLEKRGQTESAMVIKVHKNAEDDDSDNNEPFKHIGQQKQSAGYGQQQHPANVERHKLVVLLVDVV